MNAQPDDERNEDAARGIAALNDLLHQDIANHVPRPNHAAPSPSVGAWSTHSTGRHTLFCSCTAEGWGMKPHRTGG